MRIDGAIEGAILGIRTAPAIGKLKKATQGIEQIFLKQLLAQMRQSNLAKDESYGMGMYKDMMDDALATAVADRGDFGVAKQLQGSIEPILIKQELARIRLEAIAHRRTNDLKNENPEKVSGKDMK